MTRTADLALLVPVYNPPIGWADILWHRYTEFQAKTAIQMTLVVIDDGSQRDLASESLFLSEKLGVSFFFLQHEKNQGKGAALKTGASAIDAGHYIFTDVDFPYQLSSMLSVLERLLAANGVVVGYREKEYYADVSVFRTFLSRSLRALNTMLLRLPLNDTQCGLKGFGYEARNVLLACSTDRFLIDLEFLLAASAKQIQIVPVSVQLREDIAFTRFRSTVLLRELVSFFRIIVTYRLLTR